MPLRTDRKRLAATLLALGAGTMDAATGLLLVFAPAATLRLMGVPPVVPEAAVFVRYVGAFVFAIGTLYLAGLAWRFRAGRCGGLRWALGATAWVRGVICVFVVSALLAGALPAPWVSVAGTDGVLALAQGALLFCGWLRDEA